MNLLKDAASLINAADRALHQYVGFVPACSPAAVRATPRAAPPRVAPGAVRVNLAIHFHDQLLQMVVFGRARRGHDRCRTRPA